MESFYIFLVEIDVGRFQNKLFSDTSKDFSWFHDVPVNAKRWFDSIYWTRSLSDFQKCKLMFPRTKNEWFADKSEKPFS